MLANYHTHSTFCDGKNTPEEIVLYAIDNGYNAIGFSGHGYTSYDLRYCMKDTEGYITEISRLKQKHKDKIQIYCGSEEDVFSPVNRTKFDFIIGSSHYFHLNGKYYPFDSNYDYFEKCLELFNYDIIKLSKTYYQQFYNYISKRKPDIVGHFDLITKFDETDNQMFFNNPEYLKISEEYICKILKSDIIFELNTGSISRGFRKTPYPSEHLLYVLKKHNAKIMLSSDSHCIQTLDFYFSEAKQLLRDVGFKCVYALYNGSFKKYFI